MVLWSNSITPRQLQGEWVRVVAVEATISMESLGLQLLHSLTHRPHPQILCRLKVQLKHRLLSRLLHPRWLLELTNFKRLNNTFSSPQHSLIISRPRLPKIPPINSLLIRDQHLKISSHTTPNLQSPTRMWDPILNFYKAQQLPSHKLVNLCIMRPNFHQEHNSTLFKTHISQLQLQHNLIITK